ncbi:hypothetical protein D3C76_1452180 [compost metagenome]
MPLHAFACRGVDAGQDIPANIALHPTSDGLGTQTRQRNQRCLHIILHRQLALIIGLHQQLLLAFQLCRCEPFGYQPANPKAGAVIINQGFIQVEQG